MSSYLYFRSVYSLLSSLCSIEEMTLLARKRGYDSLALVDHNVLSGAIAFKKACEKNNIKPLFGLEVEIKIDSRIHNIILYAKNDEGFKNLMALSTYISTNENKIIDLDILNKYRENNYLVLFADDMPITSNIDKDEDILKALDYQKELFKNYIIALCDEDIKINLYRNQKLRKIIYEYNLPYIVLNRTYFINREDNEAYEVLKGIRDKEIIRNNHFIKNERYFLNYQQMNDLYTKKDLSNNDLFAEKLNVSLAYKTDLPIYQNKNNIPSKDYLISLCKEGLRRRLKNNYQKEYAERLRYELDVITKMHFEDYFLIVYDFVLFAKKNDIFVGPGRGSAAGSLVSYCLGITDIDPIKYGLIFERFLNPERISMPDIDIDFPDDKRHLVVEYVKNKYGKDHVAHIITYGTLKAKQCLRDVARVLDINIREVDSICKLLGNNIDMSLDKAYEEIPLFRQKIESDQKYRFLFSISKKLEFKPRHESTHAAGIVMSRKKLSEVVPLIEIDNDILSTQYSMEHLEELGLIKMDFLSIRNLTIIAEICDDINSKEKFNIRDIPLDDEKTFELIRKDNLLGVFQLESNGMRNLIKKIKPKTFEDIGVAIALFRPGPMKNIPTYLKNRENPDKIEYLHEDLKPILKETYGIIVYQEQIINIARTLAGFSYGKADILRKAMSKKKASELEKLYPDFVAGALNKGYSRNLIDKVYELIKEFANYGFNKSHSIAYSLVAYELAYLKANYPSFFYKAVLNGVIGSKTKTNEYLKESKNNGLKIRRISINETKLNYEIINNELIIPISIILDVGNISANKIISERENNGIYEDYISTVARLTSIGIDSNVIANLIYAGAFDFFKLSRNTMVSSLSKIISFSNMFKGQISLLDYDVAPNIETLYDDKLIKAENEKRVLGFYLSYNPLLEVKKKYNIDTLSLSDLCIYRGFVKGFGLVERVKNIKTKKGDNMAFVDLSDESGNISLAVMPYIYEQYGNSIIKGKYIYFEGKIEKQDSCLVNKIIVY